MQIWQRLALRWPSLEEEYLSEEDQWECDIRESLGDGLIVHGNTEVGGRVDGNDSPEVHEAYSKAD